MVISNYLCRLIGESPKRIVQLHDSTLARMKAFAIAMHIPLLLWGITGYLIANRLFDLEPIIASMIALICVVLIYLIERIVIATPKNPYVNLVRLFIGLIMAIIGASTVDLVIFQREVAMQLRVAGEASIRAAHDAALEKQRILAEKLRIDWANRQAAANCEANGTCGSRLRSVGPIYRELVNQAEILRKDYLAATLKIAEMEAAKSHEIEQWRNSDQALEESGLLARIQALHDYTSTNKVAAVAWLLFFLLVLFFELTVVLVKLAFGPTVDDHIAQIREEVSRHKASAYIDAVTSPTAEARRLMAAPT
jgi:hypothetical protein